MIVLLKKINKDCLKIIYSFMYPTKEQMAQWLIEHKTKSKCKYFHVKSDYSWYSKLCDGCRWTNFRKKKYICEINRLGNYYSYHVTFYHVNECYIGQPCSFITYLKAPLALI